ncbi:DUF4192 family protein [Corynebacterium oculi]|uniref:DUF4192 domain-containing protein n=1 Tax=Corynebacterium oculi TaxID=1544416 RepID=A0A0Q0Z4B9_9CORY|nr:DUF4192 family protein [Corynebacterium oculi]KQB84275.1 hypothetical protein Cocul_01072 [Corynebacterium oculi]
MSTYSQTLTSHGEILANIPGILGFYPQNSLVLAFFERDDDTRSVSLGPLARFDLDGAIQQLTEDRDKFTAWTEALDLDVVAAYVITDDMVEADAVAHFLCSEDSPLHSEVLAVIQTSEITAGTAWCAMYLHSNSREPQAGRISDISTSAALRQMVNDTGELPALSREEIETRLNSTEHGISAAEHKDIIEDALAYIPPLFRDVLQREYEQAAAGMTQPSARAIRSALKCFTTPRLRDPLLAALLEEPQAGFKFAEQVMRAVPTSWPGMRAQLTATVAVLAQATGQTGLAGVAAHRATEISSKETFPSLVAKLIDIGEGSRLAEVVHEGGAQARVQLFED